MYYVTTMTWNIWMNNTIINLTGRMSRSWQPLIYIRRTELPGPLLFVSQLPTSQIRITNDTPQRRCAQGAVRRWDGCTEESHGVSGYLGSIPRVDLSSGWRVHRQYDQAGMHFRVLIFMSMSNWDISLIYLQGVSDFMRPMQQLATEVRLHN